MGDLVGEHPVLAELEHRVAGVVAELLHRVEHVDRETFERAVDAGEPQDRVGGAGRLVEERGLGELADLGAHPVAELHGDLDVAGLVPALAGHVELERERRCRSSSKSKLVRPAPSSAWISPTKMPCISLRAASGAAGRSGSSLAEPVLRSADLASWRGSHHASSIVTYEA